MRKLTPTQEQLLQDMRQGIRVKHMPYLGRFHPYSSFHYNDTWKKCTADAKGLICRGLAEIGNDRMLKLTGTGTGIGAKA